METTLHTSDLCYVVFMTFQSYVMHLTLPLIARYVFYKAGNFTLPICHVLLLKCYYFLCNETIMLMQSGGFYSAEDADSLPTADAATKREGAFCVWTSDEVRDMVCATVTAVWCGS